MDYISVTDIIESTPALKSGYRTAKFTGFVATACLIISVLLIVYQFLYGQTKTNLIIWAVLLIASILLSILSRRMLRNVLYKAEQLRMRRMKEEAVDQRPEVDGY